MLLKGVPSTKILYCFKWPFAKNTQQLIYCCPYRFFSLARTLLVHQPLHLINGVSRSPATESTKKGTMKTTSQCGFGCCLTFSLVVILTEVMDHMFRKGRVSIYSELTSFFYITAGFYLFCKKVYFYFMCLSVLPTCYVCVYHIYA